MTVISSLQTYIKTYTGLKTDKPVWVNYLGPEPTEYSIVPIESKTIEEYVNGVKIIEYSFAFQSAESTADDLERLSNAGFYEAFKDWLDSQTEDEILPVLESGKTAELIEAVNGGYLFEQGESDKGIYQIECRLVYRQAKITEVSE
jgi:hypothetical protein